MDKPKEPLMIIIKGCLYLIGNVDHSIGHGYHAAKMRGDILMNVRKLLLGAVKLEKENKKILDKYKK